jgi:uracil-DNA glycosylase
MERKKQITQLLHDIHGVLSYQKTCSVVEYPGAAALDSFLNDCGWQTSVPQSPVKMPKAKKTPVNIPVTSRPVPVIKSDQNKLSEIAAEVAICSSCSLSEQRPCVIPGTGSGEAIRLLIVGHWLSTTGKSTAVFGVEEDLMLQRMLKAIKLPMENVYITNVIKCAVTPDIQPQAEHIDACSSYLVRQIAAIAPELICAMGMVATKSLLRLPQSLSQLRGRFHTYQGGDGLEIPLLPTYHPGYLLQNPEMKQATWHDLQVLEKRMSKTGQ